MTTDLAETIVRWNDWFTAVNDEQATKEWEAALSVHTDPKMLHGWATIIELNRLNRLESSIYERKVTPCQSNSR